MHSFANLLVVTRRTYVPRMSMLAMLRKCQSLKAQAIDTILVKDQMIADLVKDRDRLANEKNALFQEKIRQELGEIDVRDEMVSQ